MKPFVSVKGKAFYLPLDNIDTDQLIPARFMSRTRSQGYGAYLLHDLRRDSAGRLLSDFPLNGVDERDFLVVGANFGCGSSREAAVYALQDAGIRAVIGLGFADIFRSNAQKNGLLPVELSATDHARLCAHLVAAPDAELEVDLTRCCVETGTDVFAFQIDPGAQRKLLNGLDEITDTLENKEKISTFTKRYREEFPWIFATQ
ncbi:MAG: 3-isopropylmalate dehydratase small subunit [Paracoccaceae bacterium]